jgi:hypothetical protein
MISSNTETTVNCAFVFRANRTSPVYALSSGSGTGSNPVGAAVPFCIGNDSIASVVGRQVDCDPEGLYTVVVPEGYENCDVPDEDSAADVDPHAGIIGWERLCLEVAGELVANRWDVKDQEVGDGGCSVVISFLR